MARSVKKGKTSPRKASRSRTTKTKKVSSAARIGNAAKKPSKATQVQTVEVVIDSSVLKLVAILVLGIIAVVALLVYGKANNGVVDREVKQAQEQRQKRVEAPSVIGGSPVLGKANAPVTIFEYGDYECPFCRRHDLQTFPQIKKEYIDTGKVKYVAKNLIVVPSHKPSAEPAAYASYCVYKIAGNDMFWKFREEVVNAFEQGKYGIPADGASRVNNPKKVVAGLRAIAKKLGVNMAKYDACMKDQKEAKQFVAKDQSYVESKIVPLVSGGVGTPLFVVCRTPKDNNTECKGPVILGAYPFDTFKKTIDSLLNK